MFEPTLALGRIVHYVMAPADFGPTSVYAGKAAAKGSTTAGIVTRPAIVVETWSNEAAEADPAKGINLVVFVDGANDGYPIVPPPTPAAPITSEALQAHLQAAVYHLWKTSVLYDATKKPGTWHWPEVR